MHGGELLKYFKGLPEQEQNKILLNAYNQIAALHDSSKSFDSFSWRGCTLENDHLTIHAAVDDYFNDESRQRNILDYAGVIYCLTTGNRSAESMSWDAGRKIRSNVLREIVLTICGRNDSMEPLMEKLRQTYVDEDTFFNNYTTVDEKEGREAAEKQRRIDAQNRDSETAFQIPVHNHTGLTSTIKPWFERIGIVIIFVLCVGGYKACRAGKEIGRGQAPRQIHTIHQQQYQVHEPLRYRAKPNASDNP